MSEQLLEVETIDGEELDRLIASNGPTGEPVEQGSAARSPVRDFVSA